MAAEASPSAASSYAEEPKEGSRGSERLRSREGMPTAEHPGSDAAYSLSAPH